MLRNHKILQVVVPVYIPYILLYAVYIQLNGEVSPGGGFQAGVIFASGLIAFDLINGLQALTNKISIPVLTVGSVAGVALYLGTGLCCMLFDANFLNYSVLGSTNIGGQHLGIFMIELGVGVTVTSVMCLIYVKLRGLER